MLNAKNAKLQSPKEKLLSACWRIALLRSENYIVHIFRH